MDFREEEEKRKLEDLFIFFHSQEAGGRLGVRMRSLEWAEITKIGGWRGERARERLWDDNNRLWNG